MRAYHAYVYALGIIICLLEFAGIAKLLLVMALIQDPHQIDPTYAYFLGMTVVFGAFVSWARDHVSQSRIVYGPQAHIMSESVTRISKFSLGQLAGQDSNYSAGVVAKGEAAINLIVGKVLSTIIPNLIKILAFLGVLAYIHWFYVAIILVTGGASAIVSFYHNRKMMPDAKRHSDDCNGLNAEFAEIMAKMKTIRLFNQEHWVAREYLARVTAVCAKGIRIWTTHSWKAALTYNLFPIAGQLAVLWTSFHLVAIGSMSVLNFGIALWISFWTFGAISSIGAVERPIIESSAAVVSFFQLIDSVSEKGFGRKKQSPDKLKGDIRFVNVSFRYRKMAKNSTTIEQNRWALRNVSFTIRRNKINAIVGPSGSGKSTIIHLILGIDTPDEGDIFVGDINLKEIDLDQWYEELGYVPHNPDIMEGTLRSALLFGHREHGRGVTDIMIEKVIEQVRLEELVDQDGPDPYGTLVGRNGKELSTGQRQRIALGQAVLRNASILILDEAMNAVDSISQRLVYEAMMVTVRGEDRRTAVVIAHKEMTLVEADQVIVIEDGKLVGKGKHIDLVVTCDLYYKLMYDDPQKYGQIKGSLLARPPETKSA